MQQMKIVETDKFAHKSILDEISRQGARKMLKLALEREVEDYIQEHQEERDLSGKRVVVRNGRYKTRTLTTSAGQIEIQAPRVNDRREDEKFTSAILPPYLRKTPNLESIVPVLYLRGVSTNHFQEAFESILGPGANGFSASSIVSMKRSWEQEFEAWKKAPITEKIVYLWADGVHVRVRLGENKKVCLLVVMGVTETGKKKLLAVESGYRESAESWKIVLRSLIDRGMSVPHLAIGDGALGFWAALDELEAFKETKYQRCWVHKIANVLNALPKRLHPQVKSLLHDMMKADCRSSANHSKKAFVDLFHAKYPNAVEKIEKDWERLTSHFSFPASHWQSIRTSNPIESTFATVKLRTKATRGAGSAKTAASMAFKLMKESEKRWRSIRSPEEIQNVLRGVEYRDGIMLHNTKFGEGVA